MDENKQSSISKADSLEKMGEFWDTHDFTDYDTDAPDVEFQISCEDVKDLAIAKDFLTRRATSRSPAEMGLLRWENVAAEWDDGKATQA